MQSPSKRHGSFQSLHAALHKPQTAPKQPPQQQYTNPNAFILDDTDPELDLSTWVTAQAPKKNYMQGRWPKLNQDEMSVRLQINSADRKKRQLASNAVVEATEIYIRFGMDVLKALRWLEHLELQLFQHPQDKTVYGLMPQRGGRKLRVESPAATCMYVNFRFKNDLKHLTAPSELVEFSIHENGYLLFRLPPAKQE